MDNTGFELLGHCQPAAPEHREHRLIVRQDIGLELRQPLIASNENEVPSGSGLQSRVRVARPL